MATLLDLAAQMRALNTKITGGSSGVQKAVALAVVDYLIDNTPVDTGAAVSNYHIGAGTGPQAPYAPGEKGSTAEANRAAAKAAAHAAIAAAPDGSPIVISNPVEYVAYLNDGTTEHPPQLFVERAIAAGREIVGSFKLGITRG